MEWACFCIHITDNKASASWQQWTSELPLLTEIGGLRDSRAWAVAGVFCTSQVSIIYFVGQIWLTSLKGPCCRGQYNCSFHIPMLQSMPQSSICMYMPWPFFPTILILLHSLVYQCSKFDQTCVCLIHGSSPWAVRCMYGIPRWVTRWVTVCWCLQMCECMYMILRVDVWLANEVYNIRYLNACLNFVNDRWSIQGFELVLDL